MSKGLAAIILAAGHARRFGGPKLLTPFCGKSLILHAIDAARAAPVERIIIVKRARPELDALCRDAAGQDDRITTTDSDSDALSCSLQAGLAATGDVAGAFIFLGDMPLIPHHVADLLAEKLGPAFAALPTYQGQPGHPVLLSKRATRIMDQLSGDQGAGKILRDRNDVVRIEIDDEGVTLDVDTREDFQRLCGFRSSRLHPLE